MSAAIRDDGPALLDKLAADLQMDAEWMMRDERILTWWGAPVPLRFRVDEPVLVDGDPTIKLTVWARIVTGVSAPDDDVLALLGYVNRHATVAAFVWNSDAREVVAGFAQYPHRGIESLTNLASAFALLLYTETLGRVHAFAEQLRGSIPAESHPVNGERTDVDELLSFNDDIVLPAGQEPSKVAPVAEWLTSLGLVSNGGPTGLAAEAMVGDEGATALIQLLPVEHPTFGNGQLELLRLPFSVGDGADAVANDLNGQEVFNGNGIPAWGAWIAEEDSLIHNSFIPNALLRPGIANNVALYQVNRARWANDLCGPDRDRQ